VTYAVVWEPEAAGDIDAAWDASTESERARIVDALSLIQKSLRAGGLSVGESREYLTERVMVAGPLTAFVRVDRINSVIRVIAAVVWRP